MQTVLHKRAFLEGSIGLLLSVSLARGYYKHKRQVYLF
jgi:hypothetical protein